MVEVLLLFGAQGEQELQSELVVRQEEVEEVGTVGLATLR